MLLALAQKESRYRNLNIALGVKRCSGCKQKFPFSAFSRDRRRPLGLALYCKGCIRAQFVAKAETCIECHGPRSYAGGARCRSCYQSHCEARRCIREAGVKPIEYMQAERIALTELRERLSKYGKLRWAEAREQARIVKAAALVTARADHLERVRLYREAQREARNAAKAQRRQAKRERDCSFQKHNFVLRSAWVISLDAPIRGTDTLTIGDRVADSAPNVLEKMVASEGVFQVIQRLASEYKISIAQAQKIVDAIVDNDFVMDGSVYDLADRLRHGLQAERFTTPQAKTFVSVARPAIARPEFAEYDHFRRKYGLSRSGRVRVSDSTLEPFGGAWTVETALPEELREEVVA